MDITNTDSIDSSILDRDSVTKCENMSISIVNFNCNGFKGSYGGILKLMKDNDCVFLCETWIKPNELGSISKELNSMNFWCNMKSSINPEEVLVGRPYGGVGFVCKRLPGISYVPLPCENDRIVAVQMVAENKVLLTMVGVYLPYHNGTVCQASLYSETLEDIQCLLDANDPSPVLLLGDMNASLPQKEILNRHWYKSYPFTKHSYLLYEFLCQNDMYCCNFTFDNVINHTYAKNGSYSYIDHVFLSRFAENKVTSCEPLCLPDIVSDHLPVRTTVVVCVSYGSSNVNQLHQTSKRFPRIDWSDSVQCQSFAKHALPWKMCCMKRPTKC